MTCRKAVPAKVNTTLTKKYKPLALPGFSNLSTVDAP